MSRAARVAGLAIVCALAATAAADRRTAERHFRAGAKAYAAQSFAAAAANFDEAYRAEPLPEIAFSAAQAYRRLYRIDPQVDHLQRAAELYRAYLAKVKTGGRVGDAADNLAEMERELDKRGAAGGRSAAVAPRTRLGVSVTLADQATSEASALREIGDATGELARGLVATLDGQPVEPFALVEVEPKEHVIAVAAEGYFPVEKRAVAVDGVSALVDVELRPRPARVAVTTEPGARISVDGRGVATAPVATLELPAGTHLLTVLRRGREPFSRELVVGRGEEVAVAAPLVKTGRRRAVPWVWGGAGVLAAGAIATGIAAVVHDGRADDLRSAIDAGDRPPSDGDRYDAEVDRRDDYRTATWILGGAAVTAGVVGTLLFVFDTPSPEGRSGLRVTPAVGAGGGGVTLGGRF